LASFEKRVVVLAVAEARAFGFAAPPMRDPPWWKLFGEFHYDNN
jgi:hypothetical protein